MNENTQSLITPQEQAQLGIIQNKFNQVKKKVNESASRFERRNRVTSIIMISMLTVAGFYDLTQFGLTYIPILGWILSPVVGIYAWLTFYVWTSIEGWNMSDSIRKFVVSKILPLIGLVPVVDGFMPETTVSVLLTLLIVKSEDFVYNTTKGRLDEQVIKEGMQFFNLFRKV